MATEILRPTGTVNQTWDDWDHTKIDDPVTQPTAGDGIMVGAWRNDDGDEEVWSFDSLSTLSTVTSVELVMRHEWLEDDSEEIENISTRVKIGGSWQSSKTIPTSAISIAYGSATWTGSWTASDFTDFEVGVTAPNSISSSDEYNIDVLYVELTGEEGGSTYDETGDGGAEVAGEAEVRPFIETASGGATSGGIALRGCHAPLEDLVFSYPFDEGSGTIVHDETPNANDGTMVGVPTWVSGGGLDFNPDNTDYINMGSILDFTGDFSVACKINLDNLNFRRIIQNRGTGAYGTQAGWLLRVNSSGAIEFGLENTDNDYDGTTTNPTFLSIDTDYYIGATFNSTTGQKKVYVDGQEVLSATNANLIGSDFSSGRTSTIGVALEPSATQKWDGEIFNICVWDTVIDQSVFLALAGIETFDETGLGGVVVAGEAIDSKEPYNETATGGAEVAGDAIDQLVSAGSSESSDFDFVASLEEFKASSLHELGERRMHNSLTRAYKPTRTKLGIRL